MFPKGRHHPRGGSTRRSRQFALVSFVVVALLVSNFYTARLLSDKQKPSETIAQDFLRQKHYLQGKDTATASDKLASKDVGSPVQRRMDEEEQQDPAENLVPDPISEDFMNHEAPTQRQLQDSEPLVETKPADKQGSTAADSPSQAYFIKRGKNFHVTSRDALDLHDRLPAGTYSIGIDPFTGEYFLQTIDSFEIHGKIYGDTTRQGDRILRTFLDRKGSTGVLLAGEKGSGKTFLAKFISIEAAKKYQIPTVVVNQPLSGERFNAFIQSIQQPTVFLFDEFEKIYSEKDPRARAQEAEMADLEMMGDPHHHRPGRHLGNFNQDSMLTLLDGTYTTKMLFILTTNNKYRVSTHMRNRPGRIFYVIDFAGLPEDFIREYCNDNLKDRTMIPQILAVSTLFEAFSFDMLQAMVEEMNRYGESPEQVLSFLNVRPEFATGARYLINKLVVNGQEIPQRNIHSGTHWFGNPLVSAVQLYYEKPRLRNSRHSRPLGEPPILVDIEPEMEDEPAEEDFGGELVFTVDNIDGIDTATGTYWYWNEDKKARLVLSKDGIRAGSADGSMLQKLSELQASGPRKVD